MTPQAKTDSGDKRRPGADGALMEAWSRHLGIEVKAELAPVRPLVTTPVPREFYDSALRLVVERRFGSFTKEHVQNLMDEALAEWFERHRADKAHAGAHRARQIRALVPRTQGKQHPIRITADLTKERRMPNTPVEAPRILKAIPPAAFARVLATRWHARDRGKGIALREALMEKSELVVLGAIKPPDAGLETVPEGDATTTSTI